MRFIKYAPEHFQRLLKSIYFLFWIIAFGFFLGSNELDFITQKFKLEDVFQTGIIISGYVILNFGLNYSFKPIIERKNKSYLIAYIIDLILLVFVSIIFYNA